MIVSKVTKVAALLPPKTGSRTMVAMCNMDGIREYVSCLESAHFKHRERYNLLPDADDYRLFAFYRCPVDRAVSNFRFSVQHWQSVERIPVAKEAAAEIARQVRALTFSDYLTILENHTLYMTLDLATPQIEWLKPGVELLDFRKFDEELMRLQALMGCLQPRPIGRVNETDSADYINSVTPEEVARIKKLYDMDYEFFAEHGVTFER